MKKSKRSISHCESKSLWNFTLSPGWNLEEVSILKKALQKYGIGKWKKIIESKCLPGKSIGQIYMQTQRLIGQQSLGDFMGLQLDLESIYLENMKKQNAIRKNNCIINTGDNPHREERKRRIEENRDKFGLSNEYIKLIKLPKQQASDIHIYILEEIETDKMTTLEKLINLENLQNALEKKYIKLEAQEIAQKQSQNPVVIDLAIQDQKYSVV